MITAVIFDMDGVIADSEYFNVKAKHVILHLADKIITKFDHKVIKYIIG